MNNNEKYDNQISILNRTDNKTTENKDMLVILKEKKEKLCQNLNEVECFLSRTSCCLKMFKIYSIFK